MESTEDLVTCLQAEDFKQALHCCLLAENISSVGNELVTDKNHTWWSTFSAFKSKDNMTSDLYLDLLARFCGPATTVSVYWPTSPRIEIRTEGQGVAVTGERMTSLVLTPEQISLLTRAPPKVLLTGPPGVGKSVMLVLMALTWLRQGHDVHLVSVKILSLAATHMIYHVIQASMCDDPTTSSVVGSVHLHEYDFHNKETDVDKAINTLTATRGHRGPNVICDEFWAAYSSIARYRRFVTKLCKCLPYIYLWAASPFHDKKIAELQEERMTTPLRCPPTVLSEVQKAVNLASGIYQYTTTTLATSCDGLSVVHLSHQGPGHAGHWPLECVKCGQSIAGILQRLGLGMTDSGDNISIVTNVDSQNNTANMNKITPRLSLQFRDVFILTRSCDLRDDIKDEEGRVTSPGNGVLQGLRAAGIPVRVIIRGHVPNSVSLAVPQLDEVTMADYVDVSGLERKVVVWLQGRIPGDDDFSSVEIEVLDRLLAMSRCTAQLVVVDVPSV